jgi:exopolysaccharide production protein ExoZ
LAATTVMLGHSISVGLVGAPNIAWVHHFLFAGVDVFFVISGFLITTTALAQRRAPAWSGRVSISARFFAKRFLRIFPVYWVVLICSVAFQPWVSLGKPWIEPVPMYKLVFLFEQPNEYVPQAWTLVFEMYFYVAVSALLLFAGKSRSVWLLGWIAVQAVIVFVVATGDAPPQVWSNPLILEFSLGCSLAFLLPANPTKRTGTLSAVGVALFAAGAYWDAWIQNGAANLPPMARVVTFGLGATFVMYGVISLELRRKIWLPKLLVEVGNCSYSVYLWHLLLVTSVARAFPSDTFTWTSRNIFGAVVLCFVISISYASYLIIEKPGMSLLGCVQRKRIMTVGSVSV